MPLIELIVTALIPLSGIYYGIKLYKQKKLQKIEIQKENNYQLHQNQEIIKNSDIFLNLYTITGTVNLICLILYIMNNFTLFNKFYIKYLK